MTTSILGTRIREARKEKNLTLRQLAEFCNVGIRFLSELENGKETVELGKVLLVLKRLNIELQVISTKELQKEVLHLNAVTNG
ncbi:MAG: helix-turn-helix transcriptional regulator [Geobacter sp.]|nr:MAG: helix-turn-helix transcriptional regulator [Geobacter sp.]